MKKQPLLTRFPSTVLATSKRRLQAALAASRRNLVGHSICGYAVLFATVLAPEFLTRIDPTRRQRSFGHIPVFWAWLAQVLEANASCGKAQSLIQSWCQSLGLPIPRGDNSGYCQARLRLKKDFLRQIDTEITAAISRGLAGVSPEWRCFKRLFGSLSGGESR